MEQGDAYIQQDRETGVVQEILVVQFQTMYIVIWAFDPYFGKQFTAVQFHLLAGYRHLFVQYSVFRTAGDIQYLYFQVFLYLREISGNMNLCGQWFPYQVAEVHGSQAESILGFSDT